MNRLKSFEIAWNIIFFALKKFDFLSWIYKIENPNYKNGNIDRKYLNNVGKNQFLKVKNSLLEFIELKERELKDREVKIKREIEELFFKPIIVSIDDMDKFEVKEIKKIRPVKNSWNDGLINHIPEPITKIVGGLKIKL